jgi:hypothetical protein
MQHFSSRMRWNEDCRIHRLHTYNVEADTQLLDFDGELAELPIEIGLALELWRIRGFVEGQLAADVKLAKEILRAASWSA